MSKIFGTDGIRCLVNNEPLSDTFQDICNYAIICQLVERDQWKK